MLKIKTKRTSSITKRAFAFLATVSAFGGAYALSLVSAPAVAPFITMKPINVSTLPVPNSENRIIIPKIGVNIPYASDRNTSANGAEWRYPERGDPIKGGNFIIAAQRFSIQPNPLDTIAKSPFYNISKLTTNDKIVIDYAGVRYGYEVIAITPSAGDTFALEAPSEEAKLTLLSKESADGSATSVAITAKPLGKVALTKQ